jgi:hypothetical protein
MEYFRKNNKEVCYVDIKENSMPITPEMLNAVRFEIGDFDPSLPLMSDDEITYFLNKNNESVRRASLDAARVALMKLSQSGDQVVGIISVKGSKVAEQYRLALELYLKSPHLNPILVGLGSFVDVDGKTQNPVYAGGISNSDMLSNISNSDNNYIPNPVYQKEDSSPLRWRGAFTI